MGHSGDACAGGCGMQKSRSQATCPTVPRKFAPAVTCTQSRHARWGVLCVGLPPPPPSKLCIRDRSTGTSASEWRAGEPAGQDTVHILKFRGILIFVLGVLN